MKTSRLWVGETSAEPENEKAFRPRRKEAEGTLQTPPKTVRRAGLILLFDGEAGSGERSRDEHNRTGILTWGSTSLPPSRPLARPVAYWEFVTRYSGATVPDLHGVPWHQSVV